MKIDPKAKKRVESFFRRVKIDWGDDHHLHEGESITFTLIDCNFVDYSVLTKVLQTFDGTDIEVIFDKEAEDDKEWIEIGVTGVRKGLIA